MDTKPLTPSARKRLTKPQIRKLSDAFEASLEKKNPFSDEVQDLIANSWNEAQSEVEDAIAQALERVLARRRKGVVQALIDEVGFAYKYVNLPPEQWPLDQGSLDDIVEIHPNRVITNRELIAQLERDNQEFVSPLDVLRYVKRQKPKHPIAILFWIGKGENRRLWYLCVYVDDGGGLELDVDQYGLDDDWRGSVRFAVRPRKSLAAA